MQLVRSYAVVANGGYLVKPHLVKSVRMHGFDRDTSATHQRVISQQSADHAKKVLISVVDEGTGKLAGIKGIAVGGKTGTAQKYDPKEGRYSDTKYRASFIGFISDLDPPLVIGVTIDEPQKENFGGIVAAPLFNEIARKIISYIPSSKDFALQ